MLAGDEPADPVPAQPERDRDLPPEPQGVQPRAHPDHPVPAQLACHHRHADLDRVGHHHHDLVPRTVVGQRAGVPGDHVVVGRRERGPVDGAARRRRGGHPGRDHDHVRDHVGRVERDVDQRGVLVVGVDEVGAQPVGRARRDPAAPPDELEPRGRRQHPALDELGTDLPTDVPGRAEHRDVHPASLGGPGVAQVAQPTPPGRATASGQAARSAVSSSAGMGRANR